MHKPNDFIAFGHNRFLHENSNDSKRLGQLEGKMRLMFMCKKCKTRNSKIISKLAYNKGVIIVRCDCCKNNHLIADNLGWFSDMHKGTNIEKIMASRGESVQKIMNDIDGYYEAIANKEDKLHQDDVSQTKESDNDNKCFEKIKELKDSNKS
jgi:protein import protein ZIM17